MVIKMEGVVIHTEHVYRETPVGAVIFIFLIAVVCLVWAGLETIKEFKAKSDRRLAVGALFVATVVSLGVFCTAALNSTLTIHTDKIVTIDDTVCFNEFYEHYEVVSQDGKLYTVRELPIEETEPEEAGDNE